MSSHREASVKAWEVFCDQLKLAGGVLAAETTPGGELTQAEGLRKLVRMIRMGFSKFTDELIASTTHLPLRCRLRRSSRVKSPGLSDHHLPAPGTLWATARRRISRFSHSTITEKPIAK